MAFQVCKHLKQKLKIAMDPFMAPFEEEFHHFLEHDLKGLAVQALEEETMKTIERLSSLISRTETNMNNVKQNDWMN